LTFTVNGTDAGNVIEMNVAGGVISVSVDGVVSTASDATESSVVINGLGGFDTIRINSTGDNAVTATGGADDDSITLAESSGVLSAIAAPVYIDGGAGWNIIRAYDWLNTAAGNTHTITPTTYSSSTSATATYTNILDLRVYCGQKSDTVNINGTATSSVVYVRPGKDADSIFVNRTGIQAYVSIDPSDNTGNPDSLFIGNGTGSAEVRPYASITMGSISISNGGLLKLNPGGATTITTQSLSLNGNGSVDLADNAMIVDYGTGPSPFSTLRSYLANGYNGGLWTGIGIRSSTAAGTIDKGVGIVESSSIFSNYPVNFASSRVQRPAVLLRQTLYGDTDLDTKVGLADFNRVALNFGRTGRQWIDGDFDFGGSTILTDFNRLSGNFGKQGLPSAPAPLGVSVVGFGAVPNDGIDDTAAIRAAINSLPLGVGAPIGKSPAGGTVLFPAGTFDISGTIRLPSGVTLQGAGAATVINDRWNDSGHAAFELYSPYSHHWNIGVSLVNLTIFSAWGGGVRIDPNMGGDVVDFRMSNVRVSAAGVGIDLRAQFVVHSDLDNVEIFNPGSTAVYLGRYDTAGFSIRVRNMKITGAARSGFIAEKGLAMITTDVNVYGLSITTTGAPVVPLYVSGSVTMDDLQISPSVFCPGGVAVLIEGSPRVLIDNVNNVGLGRRLKLVDAHDVQIRNLITDGTSNLFSQLLLIDARSYARVSNSVNGMIVAVTPTQIPDPHVRASAPTTVIDVRAFGAIPNDGLDDSAAIQAAIDSVPLGDGIGTTALGLGAIIQFPLGTMTTTVPLRLPSGVWLRGQENGSILENITPDSSRGAIELYSPFGHGWNVGAGIDGLGISTTRAAAIKSDSSIVGELRDLHISGLRINSAGVGIDFRNVLVSFMDVDRVVFTDPGTTAMWIGRPDNFSHDNIIRGARMAGRSRPNFVPERALWVMYGKNRIEGGSLEDTLPDHPVLPFYGSGSIDISGLYMEFIAQPDGLSFVFENASSVTIDRLYHINPQRRISFINVADAYISNLNIDGTVALLQDCIDFDSRTHVTLDAVNGFWDTGMLDNPQLTINGFYNETGASFVETRLALGTPNLLKDPNITSVGDDIWNVSDWQIVWGNGYQGRLGTFSVETVGGIPRLRIDVPQMVNVAVRIRLNVSGANVGRGGIARWRIDGPTQAFVFNKDSSWQYPVRVMNSLTAARTLSPLQTGDEITVALPNALGTYYLSQFGMVAM
jgi:polygalacturonase